MSRDPMDLSIIIVSFNTRDITMACIRSVSGEALFNDYELIVVDNNSSDGSAEAIAREFPHVVLLQPGKNLGFAGANNLACEHARGEYLLLLNPDTVVLDHAIDKLLSFAKAHRDADIFGGRTCFADKSLNPGSCWRTPSLWSVFCIVGGLTAMFPRSRLFNREAYGGWNRDSVREVDIVSGCFLMMRRELWSELQGFDPVFFMYGEEADLCWRALKMGKRCLINPEAQIIHYGGASEKVRADKMVRLFSAKAMLFKRHWKLLQARIGIFGLDLWAASRVAAFAMISRIRTGRRESFQTWLKIWQRRKEWHVKF